MVDKAFDFNKYNFESISNDPDNYDFPKDHSILKTNSLEALKQFAPIIKLDGKYGKYAFIVYDGILYKYIENYNLIPIPVKPDDFNFPSPHVLIEFTNVNINQLLSMDCYKRLAREIPLYVKWDNVLYKYESRDDLTDSWKHFWGKIINKFKH